MSITWHDIIASWVYALHHSSCNWTMYHDVDRHNKYLCRYSRCCCCKQELQQLIIFYKPSKTFSQQQPNGLLSPEGLRIEIESWKLVMYIWGISTYIFAYQYTCIHAHVHVQSWNYHVIAMWIEHAWLHAYIHVLTSQTLYRHGDIIIFIMDIEICSNIGQRQNSDHNIHTLYNPYM